MMIRFLPILIFLTLQACTKNDQPGSEEENYAGLIVKPVNIEGLDSIIIHRDDKILLLNLWASWCVPCIEEFPDLVKISQFYRQKNVQVVAVSVDEPEDIETKVKPFLVKQQVKFSTYYYNSSKPEELINFLNKDWNGALPATFIFDQSGNQKYFLLGKQSFDTFETSINALLN